MRAALVVAGIAVLRARRWRAWHRRTPLAVGAYVVAVLTPVLLGNGGPPAPAALWSIAGRGLLWALLAASALSEEAADGEGAGDAASAAYLRETPARSRP